MLTRTRRLSLDGPDRLEPRELPSVSIADIPVLPDFDPATLVNVRRVAYLGMVHGLRSDSFLKVGDSNTDTAEFLQPIGRADYNPVASGLIGLPAAIQEAVQAFRSPVDAAGDNSFTRDSLASGFGWTVPVIVAGVAQELTLNRGGIALVMAGTNDLLQYDDSAVFGGWLRTLVNQLTTAGVVPVLSTIPTNHFLPGVTEQRAAEHNQVIAEVAAETRVPLLNLWRALDGLPNNGLKVFNQWGRDEVHLTVSPNGGGGLTPFDQLFGQNLRAVLTLTVLAEIRQLVFNFDRPAPMPAAEAWTAIAPGQAVFATGAETGQPAVVTVSAADSQVPLDRIAPYPLDFYGGVRVAVGDVDGDGVPDIVTAPGPGGGPLVMGFSGADGHELFAFFAFEPEFRGGVTVAVGDADGDGHPEIVVGAGEGGGPRVRVFRASDLAVVDDFLAFEPSFRGGVTVAAGDFGVAVGAGEGGAPLVKVFDPQTGQERAMIAAYDLGFRGGVSVAAGDLVGAGRDELVTGSGPGGGPMVRVFDPLTGQPGLSFFAGDPSNQDGVRVAVVRPGQLIAVSGGGQPSVRLFDSSGNLVGGADVPASLGAS
jgi:hypothetical protein